MNSELGALQVTALREKNSIRILILRIFLYWILLSFLKSTAGCYGLFFIEGGYGTSHRSESMHSTKCFKNVTGYWIYVLNLVMVNQIDCGLTIYWKLGVRWPTSRTKSKKRCGGFNKSYYKSRRVKPRFHTLSLKRGNFTKSLTFIVQC